MIARIRFRIGSPARDGEYAFVGASAAEDARAAAVLLAREFGIWASPDEGDLAALVQGGEEVLFARARGEAFVLAVKGGGYADHN